MKVASEKSVLLVFSVFTLFTLLISLACFKTVLVSFTFFISGLFYLLYITLRSFNQKRIPFGFITRGAGFLLLSAGLMILFEHLSKIEAIRIPSIFAYIFVYIYSWNPVTNAVGVAWLGRTQAAYVLSVFLFFSMLAFYEFIYRLGRECLKSNIDKRIFIPIILLLALGGVMGAWYNTFPREELIIPVSSDEEYVFLIDAAGPFFGFFELEVLRIHGIEKADWFDRNEHGPILVRTTPDRIKRVNFGWTPIRYAPDWESWAPRGPNEGILQIVPRMLYRTFLVSQVWLVAILFALFYHADRARAISIQKFSFGKYLPWIILIALLAVTLSMSFPVTLRFEEGIPREDYSNFLDSYEYFRPGWLHYQSYPGGGGTAHSSRDEPVIHTAEKEWEKSAAETAIKNNQINKIEDFVLIHRIKVVYGYSPTFYSLYLWSLPKVSVWTRGHVHLLMILTVFALSCIYKRSMRRP